MSVTRGKTPYRFRSGSREWVTSNGVFYVKQNRFPDCAVSAPRRQSMTDSQLLLPGQVAHRDRWIRVWLVGYPEVSPPVQGTTATADPSDSPSESSGRQSVRGEEFGGSWWEVGIPEVSAGGRQKQVPRSAYPIARCGATGPQSARLGMTSSDLSVMGGWSGIRKFRVGTTAEQQPQMPFDSPAAPIRSGRALPTRCATRQDDRRQQHWLAARYPLPATGYRYQLLAPSCLFLRQPHHELRPPRF